MLDFLMISTRSPKRGTIEIYPKFRLYPESSDLMIRGGDFYAIWDEERGLWSTNEGDALRLIDREMEKYAKENADKFEGYVKILYMRDSDSGMIDAWHKYCQKQKRDCYEMLDENLIFSNSDVRKDDYASKRLSYPLEDGDTPAWDKLISTLYSEEERHKIEWAIGSIVSGASKDLQKFMVLYGSAGTGKSTILNIIQQLFEGYYSVFDAKALGSSSNQFALEAFKKNPLVAIQHDGDLSKIEDNTRLNSLVSHELMSVNEKHKGLYENRFKCFLFMGTNKPVKITDAKSGLIRRLIDVTPSGNKLNPVEYKTIMSRVSFELGPIAYHCREVFLDDPGYYDDYIPTAMMGASNDFYNFVIDSYHIFVREDGTTLRAAWELYRQYCEDAKLQYPFSQRVFKEELKNYFRDYSDRFSMEDGTRVRSYYSGFRTDKFETPDRSKKEKPKTNTIDFDQIESIFDKERADCFAQYANPEGTPLKAWDNVKTRLSDLNTRELHYVRVPENHIVIDFDIPDEQGNKCFERNLEAASKWPPTYAEVSKSGQGIHLHYIYSGDPTKLSRIYDDHIEVKVYTGKSTLRRKLTKCNNLPIATISSGLPLKGEDAMINFEGVRSEKVLRTMIKRNLNKEIHPATKPSVDFIYKILEDAYNSDLKYDVSDMYNAVLAFAANSTNQADYCLKLVDKMHFQSDNISVGDCDDGAPIAFYDVEVFPNLFLVNWKFQGEGNPVVRMINPKPHEVEDLMKFRLIGFNCRRYDNHILYARMMGYDNMQLYNLSQKIIGGDRSAFFGEAYNVSYTDVYDFASEKQSLKKWEIELGIHHQELGLPWDQPVPEERWVEVAEYCDNDVLATEAVFNARQGDFMARKIQVDLVKLMHGIDNVTVNDTTNSLSAKIIFGRDKNPQREFNYRDLSKPVGSDQYEEYRRRFGDDYVFRVFDDVGLPVYRDYIPGEVLPKGWSILPFFKEYVFERGKSTYLGEEIGEGGRVFARPGMYIDVWDGDIASQHPHSMMFEVIFGPKYTKRLKEIVLARVAIKHKDFETAGQLLGGALKPYLNDEFAADLAQALKIVINSIYGLTSAAFENEFKDPRNKDNIVAKRGALFMTLLKREVEKLGYTVAHIKTDSIKIPNADERVMKFVTDFGKEYGYSFETEANFSRFCLVNDAVYIARFADGKNAGKWTPTGKQFAVPYVFKSLFSKEPIEFEDLCETMSVTTALYLDSNEMLPDVTESESEVNGLLEDIWRVNRGEDPVYIEKAKERIDTLVERLNRPGYAGKRRMTDEAELATHENTIREYRQNGYDTEAAKARIDILDKVIAEGHDYRFIGKVSSFCPIKPMCGGGTLLRQGINKYGRTSYSAPPGSKNYLWLESEMVKALGKENDIDRTYYDKLVDDAVATIAKYGDFEWFVADDIQPPEGIEELPWLPSCGNAEIGSCWRCPHLHNDQFHLDCRLGYDISDIMLQHKNLTTKEN